MNAILSSLLFLGSALAAPASVELTAEELSCRNASRAILSWNIIDFDFHSSYTFSTPSHQIAGGYVNFTLENAALEYRPVCAASSSQLQDFFYGNVVYDCQVPPAPRATRPRSASTAPRGGARQPDVGLRGRRRQVHGEGRDYL
uniref:AA1-like domain-containing protein n=1 Tax=Bionectria ochroleuca TaxID=29856 RepID=A0A8H7N6K1_BIOOC